MIGVIAVGGLWAGLVGAIEWPVQEIRIVLPATVNPNGHLFISATLGQDPATHTMMLDSGANNLTFNDEKALVALSLPRVRTSRVSGGGGIATVGTYRLPEMNVGPLRIVDEEWQTGLKTIAHEAGLLGTPFLRGHIVEISYKRREVVFSPSNSFDPPRGAITVQVTMEQNLPWVDMVLNGARMHMLLDSGAGGVVVRVSKEAARREGWKSVGTKQVVGVVGTETAGLVALSQIRLGSITLPPLTVEAEPSHTGDGILGAGALLMFERVIFDLDHRKVHFIPKPWLGLAFDVGVGLTVLSITPGSPADHAGLREGDELVKMDGRPLDSVDTLSDLLFEKSVGDTLNFSIHRNGKALGTQVVLTPSVK